MTVVQKIRFNPPNPCHPRSIRVLSAFYPRRPGARKISSKFHIIPQLPKRPIPLQSAYTQSNPGLIFKMAQPLHFYIAKANNKSLTN